jgi:tripartite-type tricarboxylate transporter receptor subunit TctC
MKKVWVSFLKVNKFFLSKVVTALGFVFTVCSSQAQEFPNKPVTLVVPFSTGTGADILSRVLGPKLADQWKVGVITDNRVGASGVIGTDHVAKSPANGYTLLVTATAHGTVPALSNKLPYDPVSSFTPVILLGTSSFGLVTSAKSGISSFKDFVALAKKTRGELMYSSPGQGAPQHLAMELLSQEAGIKLLHVPYKGTSGALTDLIGNQIQVSVVALQTASVHINSGNLKLLAQMGSERSSAYSKVPTLKELGLPGAVVESWYGVLAPIGTPVAVVSKLNADFNALLLQSDVKEALAKQGLSVAGGKPERLQDLIKSELKLWTRVVDKAGIEKEN